MKTIENINSERHSECILTAIEYTGVRIDGKKEVKCLCRCGNIVNSIAHRLKCGNTKSCGCLKQLIGNKTGKSIGEINRDKPSNSRLTAVEFISSERKNDGRKARKIKCVCSCGNEKITFVDNIVSGVTTSCGCAFKEMLKETKTKYHPQIPELHRKWKHVIARCYNKNNRQYRYYGGRGVIMCDEWKNSYQSFLNWALANGWQPGLHIDKDKKGNGLLYSPETCCFLTAKENNQYRRKRSCYKHES